MNDKERVDDLGEDKYEIELERIEWNYLKKRGLIEREEKLMRNVERIRNIKGVIVNGR